MVFCWFNTSQVSRAARSAVRDLSLVRLMRAFIFLVHSQKGPIVQIRTFYDLLIFYGTFTSYVRNLNEIDWVWAELWRHALHADRQLPPCVLPSFRPSVCVCAHSWEIFMCEPIWLKIGDTIDVPLKPWGRKLFFEKNYFSSSYRSLKMSLRLFISCTLSPSLSG